MFSMSCISIRRLPQGRYSASNTLRPASWLAIWLACAGVGSATDAVGAPQTTLDPPAEYSCQQPLPDHLECDLRLTTGPFAGKPAASVGEIKLEAPQLQAYPGANDTTAVLFLIDTSDPRRQAVVRRNAEHVAALVKAAKPHHRLGLASFDSDLRLLVPLGSPNEEVAAKLAQVKAAGLTTELYHSALAGVKLLGEYQAKRKALFLMSDGLAEDRAYSHQDVITAARESGVVIYGMGYPKSTAQSVALQTLRRLADESGGWFVNAGAQPRLPEALLANAYAAIDSGGHLSFDLKPAIAAGITGPNEVHLGFGEAKNQVRIPVQLINPAVPVPPPSPVSDRTLAPSAAAETTPPPAVSSASEKPTTAPTPSSSSTASKPPLASTSKPGTKSVAGGYETLAWYLIPALLLGGLGWWAYRRSQGKAETEVSTPLDSAAEIHFGTPFGWVTMRDNTESRHAIRKNTFRMGRSGDNELTLDDSSVSRQHAEIRREDDGSLTLRDLNSLNGVYVNDKQIRSHKLSDGDSIDIGDIGLRFTLEEPSSVPEAEEPEATMLARKEHGSVAF